MSTEDQNKNLAILDFETLSTRQNAVVLSMAVTVFNVHNENPIGILLQDTMFWNFNTIAQNNRDIEESTLEWWEEQSKEAKDHHRQEPLWHPKEALIDLTKYLKDRKTKYLIGNGIGFDNVLLKNLCQEYGVDYPVPYWGDLDLRTMRWLTDMKKPEFPKELTPHISSHDTVAEAIVFQQYYEDIKNGNHN